MSLFLGVDVEASYALIWDYVFPHMDDAVK